MDKGGFISLLTMVTWFKMADRGHLIDSEIFENIEEEYFNLANRAV